MASILLIFQRIDRIYRRLLFIYCFVRILL